MDLATAFGAVNTTLMDAIGDVLPIVLGIFGTLLAVKLGMKFVKRASS